jgi:hypothetical protein
VDTVTIHDSSSGAPAIAQTREYSSTSRARSAGKEGARTLRFAFFGASAIWGMIIGAGGLVAGIGFSGVEVQPGWREMLWLLPAAAVAVAGAGVIAGAYQEAKRRRR